MDSEANRHAAAWNGSMRAPTRRGVLLAELKIALLLLTSRDPEVKRQTIAPGELERGMLATSLSLRLGAIETEQK